MVFIFICYLIFCNLLFLIGCLSFVVCCVLGFLLVFAFCFLFSVLMLEVGGWWLEAGGWRLIVDGWRLGVRGYRLDIHSWRFEVGGLRLEVRDWRLEVGG